MTDRLKGVIVTFDRDIRVDDAEFILNAIRAIKHVTDVSPLVTDHTDHIARARIRSELYTKLLDLIKQELC